MCKWNLHRGGDVEAMRTRWHGGGSEEELGGARRAEAGLYYRSESSSERRMTQPRGNTRYKSGNVRKSPYYETRVIESGGRKEGIGKGAGTEAEAEGRCRSNRRERRLSE